MRQASLATTAARGDTACRRQAKPVPRNEPLRAAESARSVAAPCCQVGRLPCLAPLQLSAWQAPTEPRAGAPAEARPGPARRPPPAARGRRARRREVPARSLGPGLAPAREPAAQTVPGAGGGRARAAHRPRSGTGRMTRAPPQAGGRAAPQPAGLGPRASAPRAAPAPAGKAAAAAGGPLRPESPARPGPSGPARVRRSAPEAAASGRQPPARSRVGHGAAARVRAASRALPAACAGSGGRVPVEKSGRCFPGLLRRSIPCFGRHGGRFVSRFLASQSVCRTLDLSARPSHCNGERAPVCAALSPPQSSAASLFSIGRCRGPRQTLIGANL